MKKTTLALAMLAALALVAPAQASYSTAPSMSQAQAGDHVAKKGSKKAKAPKSKKA